MKTKIYIFIAMLMLAVLPAAAQGKDEKSKEEMRKELHEFKLKFLAQEMQLKPSQQKSFFELYDKMSEERRKIFAQARRLNKKVRDDKNATDEDFEKAANEMAKAKARYAEVEKTYDEKFAAFLSKKQIYKMKEAENEFHERMKQMRKDKK